MTYADYLAFVRVYRENHPEQRFGQAAVNVLRSITSHAYLVDTAQDRDIDPFNRDDLKWKFLLHVKESW